MVRAPGEVQPEGADLTITASHQAWHPAGCSALNCPSSAIKSLDNLRRRSRLPRITRWSGEQAIHVSFPAFHGSLPLESGAAVDAAVYATCSGRHVFKGAPPTFEHANPGCFAITRVLKQKAARMGLCPPLAGSTMILAPHIFQPLGIVVCVASTRQCL